MKTVNMLVNNSFNLQLGEEWKEKRKLIIFVQILDRLIEVKGTEFFI